MSTTCGSELHFIDGYVPTMRRGDVIGHEFMGVVVDVGREVKKVKKGDRVVVPSFIVCGSCWYCQHNLYSLCDNTNPNAEMQELAFGYPTAGIYGYTHAFGGYAGAHAQYVRVPYADNDCYQVPDGLRDEQVLFLSDAAPTGYMGADFCDIQPTDTVAVWGCGGVGQMAIKSAFLMGANRVIAIDRFPERLRMAREKAGAETINYTEVDSVVETLKEMTGGRGPDACIDAVGMEAHGTGIGYAYDRVKQSLRLETDRGEALREAIMACRKGGTLSILGVYGIMDKFPIGSIMNKGLTVRSAQQHGQSWTPRISRLTGSRSRIRHAGTICSSIRRRDACGPSSRRDELREEQPALDRQELEQGSKHCSFCNALRLIQPRRFARRVRSHLYPGERVSKRG
jgi:threonine dehydrogenase-like Zn-dependent dehydrogenase